MHRFFSPVVILCAVMPLFPLRAAEQPTPVRVPCFANPPELKLDGIPDEPFWQKAGKISNFRRFHAVETPAEAATTVRLALDRRNLYLALECDEPRGIAVGSAAGSPWSGDNVEIFLASLAGHDWYRQIVLGLNGKTYQEFIGEADYQKQIHATSHRWTAELVIPREKLGDFAADTLRFNMLRKRVNADETQTWGNVHWAHEPNRFGMLQVYAPAGEVTHGPWLFDVAADAAGIAWEHSGHGRGTLFVRRAGTETFTSHPARDRAAGDATYSHVFLRGLAPDTVYEYHTGDHELRTFRTFTPAPADFSFGVLTDTHCRNGHLADILSRPAVRDSDIVFLVGDMVTGVTGSGVCYDGFLDTVVRHRQKATLCIRGNHEYRGNAPEAFLELLSPRNRRSYTAFTHKGVFFLVLDTGDGMTDPPSAYEETQREWLRRTVTSPEFSAAQFRVLLAHHPLRHLEEGGGLEVLRLYQAIPPEAAKKIDLMLSGHVHIYSRQLPGKAELYSPHPARNGKAMTILPPFPVLTCDFDGAFLVKKDADKLLVTAWGKGGKTLDELVVPRKK